MATFISDECTNCCACVVECPNGAISEGEEISRIDPERCTECVGFHDGPACAAVCPVEACVPDPDRREDRPTLIERWYRLHPGLDPGRH